MVTTVDDPRLPQDHASQSELTYPQSSAPGPRRFNNRIEIGPHDPFLVRTQQFLAVGAKNAAYLAIATMLKKLARSILQRIVFSACSQLFLSNRSIFPREDQ